MFYQSYCDPLASVEFWVATEIAFVGKTGLLMMNHVTALFHVHAFVVRTTCWGSAVEMLQSLAPGSSCICIKMINCFVLLE